MTVSSLVSALMLLAGCLFFLAGTVGLLRFPDTLSRLHALTKADNLGLMMICAALALQSQSLRVSMLLGLIWLFAIIASTLSAHLIARRSDHLHEDR